MEPKFAMEKSMGEPQHVHNIDHVGKNYGGDGHMHEHEKNTKHGAGYKKFHEHVKAMCGGGYTSKVKG